MGKMMLWTDFMSLNLADARLKIDELTKIYQNGGWERYEYFGAVMREQLTHEEAKQLLTAFSSCECCDRHMNSRPSKLSDEEYGQSFLIDIDECKCDCRNICRFIYREFRSEGHEDSSESDEGLVPK